YWPLERWNTSAIPRLIVEKIPFFLLTAASCVITYMAQNRGAVKSLAAVPLTYRLENAPVAVAGYLLKLIWPGGLAVIYPMPHSIAAVAFMISAVILVFITFIAWMERKRNPFLPVGWFWFLGMLVPVIGLVKVGDAAMADRYMYIPSIGIFVAVAFGAQKMVKGVLLPRFILPAMAILILGALAVVTERQLQFWRDDETLFKHAMEVTSDNVDAMINYGVALEYNGKPMEAMAQYRQAEQLAPDSYMARADLGNLLSYTGDTNGALEEFRQAVQLAPKLPALHERLGNLLADMGHFSDATNELYRAISLNPAEPSSHLNLGIALAAHDDMVEATNEFSEAMRLEPMDPAPLVEWSKALLQQGRDAEAVDKLHEALQLDPDDFPTLAFAARVLAADEDPKIRDGKAALTYAQQADALTSGTQPLVQDVLGMAYAENGQFDEAQAAVTNAISLAMAAGMKSETITAMQGRLELYQKHEPWREAFQKRDDR
ncbi:MAG TPA: tetratricopeptide repeat protein, partial [Candidatus Acidoferrum sp.]|nr:tetratricopeptide repeat protein [Candidatus Acidoferrum sp.]